MKYVSCVFLYSRQYEYASARTSRTNEWSKSSVSAYVPVTTCTWSSWPATIASVYFALARSAPASASEALPIGIQPAETLRAEIRVAGRSQDGENGEESEEPGHHPVIGSLSQRL